MLLPQRLKGDYPMVTKRQTSQQKLRVLMLQQSNGYGFLDRQFLADTGSELCIIEANVRTQKTGQDAGKEKWWILAVAPNIDGENETGYLTFDRNHNRDRFFSALTSDNDLLPAHNLYIEKIELKGGKSYYDIKLGEDDKETCPCTPYQQNEEEHPF